MSTPKRVLHVDDDEDDLAVFKDAIATADPQVDVFQEQSAAGALHYLNSTEDLPCLMVIDLNMPVMSGKELLPLIKSNPKFSSIAVFAFTTSSLQSDKDFCASFGVECITKPLLFNDVVAMGRYMLESCVNDSQPAGSPANHR